MSDTTAARLIVEVGARDTGAEALLSRIEGRLQRANTQAQTSGAGIGASVGAGAARARPAVDQLAAAQARASREHLATAAALARSDAQAGNYDAAVRRLTGALNQAQVVNVRQGIGLQQQVTRYQQAGAAAQQAAGVFSRANAAIANIGNIAGATIFAAGTQQIVAFAQETADLSLRTQAAQNSLRALAGSSEFYADALATAREQQRLFGGTLAENIEGVQGLVTVSRSSGVELQKLIDLSQRLAIKDPSQGTPGARIALQEALSGDPTSLARRYEIPRKALAALRDESTSGADKIAIIDKYLSDIGITSEVVSGSIPKATLAFNGMNASLEGLKVKLGDVIANGLAPAAQGITALSNALQGQGANETLVALAETFATLTGNVDGYSASERNFASNLLNSVGIVSQREQATRAAADADAQAAAAELAHAATATALANAWAAGTITQAQFDQGMAQLTASAAGAATAQEAQTAATQDAAAAAAEAGTAIDEEAGKALVASVNTETLTVAKERLKAQAEAAAASVIAGGGDIEATAARLAASSSLVDQLTAAYIRLQIAQGAAARAAGAARIAAQRSTPGAVDNSGLIGFDAPGRRGSSDVDAVIAQQQANAEEARDAAAAQREYEEAVGGAAVELKNLYADLNKATSASERYRIQTQIARLEQQRASSRGGGGGASAKARSDELKAQQDFQERSLDLAADYEDKMAQIAEDGARKAAEAQRKYDLARVQSRASFYRQLAEIDDPKQQAAMSAAYEAAVADAQRIAKEKGADVAQEYLAAQQDIIRDQAALQAEIDKAREEGDDGRAEYLTGVLALQKEADAARLQAIIDSNDSILAQQQQAYAREQEAYAKHLDELGATYARKAAELPGFATTLAAPAASAAAAAAPSTTTTPPPAPGTPEAPQGAQLVSDPATQAAIDSVGARLEGRINEVVSQVGAAVTRLGDVEDAIRSLGRRSQSALAP